MGERYAGRYELVDPLGEGGSGTVWRVWDHRRGRYVAAKLLRQRDSAAVQRFVREQSLRVRHPHVAPPIGWAAEDDDVLLTMELVAGGSVGILLGDYGRLPVSFVVPLLDQLLDALAAVHEAGLVHRDIKPGNLLLEPTGTAAPCLRLADFGIAAVAGEPRYTQVGHVVGTPGYLAPEARAGAEPAAAQDIWAAGVVAWQMLTGVEPPGSGPADLGVRPPDVPAGLWRVLGILTDPDPDRRPADAVAARALLACEQPSWGAAGAGEVEVFDQLAALPTGWSPEGPDAGVDPDSQAGHEVPAAGDDGWTTNPRTGESAGWAAPTALPATDTQSATDARPATDVQPATTADTGLAAGNDAGRDTDLARPGPPTPSTIVDWVRGPGRRAAIIVAIVLLAVGVALVVFGVLQSSS